jgi:hypothetical protein
MSRADLTPNRDLVLAAVSLGRQGVLGSYPEEQQVLAAVLGRCRRPIAVSDRLIAGLADVYDEARAEADSVPL